MEELRDLASGIHPAVLSQRGLDAALESLATRSPVPVELDVVLDERLPAAAETAAYFVVAEALTNVAKYAEATYASVDGPPRERRTRWSRCATTAIGGADAAAGSGLLGLGDRVGALDGTHRAREPARPGDRGARADPARALSAHEGEYGEDAAMVLGRLADAELGEDRRSRASPRRRA